MASVGITTTKLGISRDQPFGRFVTAHADHRRADKMRHDGSGIEIVNEDEILSRLALASDTG